jgi:hypothetical protein
VRRRSEYRPPLQAEIVYFDTRYVVSDIRVVLDYLIMELIERVLNVMEIVNCPMRLLRRYRRNTGQCFPQETYVPGLYIDLSVTDNRINTAIREPVPSGCPSEFFGALSKIFFLRFEQGSAGEIGQRVLPADFTQVIH